MSRSVLVTGGAGYIGSHTVLELVKNGYNPIIIDDFSNSEESVLRNIAKLVNKEITCYKGKVQDRDLLNRVFDECDLFAVIHFAASKAVGESVQKPLLYYGNNIDSLLVLLEVMHDRGVNNLVFSSSCTVYGQPDRLPVTEDTPRKDAESPYGNTKKICEDIIQDFAKVREGFCAISLRYFNPIGADSSALIGELPKGVPANLVPFITQTAAGIRDKLTVFGDDYDTVDGSCVRDYIHVTDLAAAHVSAMEYMEKFKNKGLYDIFNVGVGKGYSVLEVIHSFEKVTGVPVAHEIGPRRPGDVVKIYADTNKINAIMGWKAKLTLDEALLHAWQWQQRLVK